MCMYACLCVCVCDIRIHCDFSTELWKWSKMRMALSLVVEKHVSAIWCLLASRCCLLNKNTWTYTLPHQLRHQVHTGVYSTQHVPAVSVLGCNSRYIQGVSVLSLYNEPLAHQPSVSVLYQDSCVHTLVLVLNPHSHITSLGQLSSSIILEMSVR